MILRLVASCFAFFIVAGRVSPMPAVHAQGRAGDGFDRDDVRVQFQPIRSALQPLCGGYMNAGFSTCFDNGQTVLFCPWCGEQSMHGCPAGFAMTGAGSGNNVFRCSYVGPYWNTYFERGNTQRQQSIACAPGYFMIGMHEEHNILQCASIARPVVYEYRANVGSFSPCVGAAIGYMHVMTGWNRQGRYMLCAVVG